MSREPFPCDSDSRNLLKPTTDHHLLQRGQTTDRFFRFAVSPPTPVTVTVSPCHLTWACIGIGRAILGA